ncbi:MAG: septation protein SepH [Aquiluna sp.]|nr:septation protein SepH [Aquiluna sp.]
MDIRFVSRDGEDLIFESDAGDRFIAPIDDALRASLKNNPRVITADFSPKFVQDQLRQGRSVEQIATDLGVETSSLEPFAAPILDELRFVLQAALDTQVTDGNVMRRFEDLVSEEFPNAEFRVHKHDGSWTVEVDSDQLLSWRFDPKLRHIEPTSPASTKLAKAQSSRDVISSANPKVRPTPETQATPEHAQELVDASSTTSASVHSLVEELRSRRSQEEIKPATAKGRASLPSWDEIVLGTTNSETDAE